jgi:hypothetical protein
MCERNVACHSQTASRCPHTDPLAALPARGRADQLAVPSTVSTAPVPHAGLHDLLDLIVDHLEFEANSLAVGLRSTQSRTACRARYAAAGRSGATANSCLACLPLCGRLAWLTQSFVRSDTATENIRQDLRAGPTPTDCARFVPDATHAHAETRTLVMQCPSRALDGPGSRHHSALMSVFGPSRAETPTPRGAGGQPDMPPAAQPDLPESAHASGPISERVEAPGGRDACLVRGG